MNKSTIMKNINKADITNYELSEFGMAELFKDIFGEVIKHVISEKEYYIYNHNTGIWKKDVKENIERHTERFLSVVCPTLIEKIEDEEDRRMYASWIKKRQSNSAIANILKSVRRKKNIAIESSAFDKYERYFKLKDCVYDLKLNECIPNKKKYMVSKSASVRFIAEVSDDTWNSFLMEIMGRDEYMCDYLLRMIGYAMQGNPVDHCMFILYGKTMRNGKSTFVEGLGEYFGNYGTSLPPESLSKNRNSRAGTPTSDIAKLRGVRFVNIAEAPNNLKLDVALIKALTGMDSISARKLYSDYVDFVNKAVFVMHLNRFPIVDDATLFISKRIIAIPFDVHFSKSRIDTRMLEKLVTEKALSGLLNEVIRIQEKYRGLSMKKQLPKAVRDVTSEFENKCDPVGYFIKRSLKREARTWVATKDVHSKYEELVKKEGLAPITQRALTLELENRGYKKTRIGKIGYRFNGISLK